MDLAGGVWIVFGPDPDELVEMVSAQDRRVAGEVVEVVHDDGDEEIQHEERAEEDEGHEVDVGDIGAATLRVLLLVGLGVAVPALYAGQHDVWPGLARCAPKVESHDGLSTECRHAPPSRRKSIGTRELLRVLWRVHRSRRKPHL